MKKLIISTLLLVTTLFYLHHVHTISEEQQILCKVQIPLEKTDPEHVEFAWDMHSVFVKKSIPGMIVSFIYHDLFKVAYMAAMFTYDYIRYLLTGSVGQTLQLIRDIRSLHLARASGGPYVQLLNAYRPGWGSIVLNITSHYHPTPSMTNLIRDLSRLGYIQRIASNADELLFDQQKEQYPELFAYLNGGKIVDYDGTPPWTKKPHIQFFKDYQKKYDPNGTKTIIFVDNSVQNVSTAAQAGMVGILFQNSLQLRQKLIFLGIPLKIEPKSALPEAE